MMQAPESPRGQLGDLAKRRESALQRIEALTGKYETRARRAFRNYYVVQGVTIGFAALTPCLIFLANDNPSNKVFEWLQLFLPTLAAIAAGFGHIFHWREDGVRYTNLAEGIRSRLWRFETRAGEFATGISDEQAL